MLLGVKKSLSNYKPGSWNSSRFTNLNITLCEGRLSTAPRSGQSRRRSGAELGGQDGKEEEGQEGAREVEQWAL